MSDSGQVFTVRVTVTGDDYGNTGQAEAEFGIALLGDVNNDGVVDVADRAIVNGFWRTLRQAQDKQDRRGRPGLFLRVIVT